MTPEERSIVSSFLNDLEQFRGTPKDKEAADLIDGVIRENPDAPYVLVQHAILANRALQNAKARIDELEAPQRGSDAQPSFLGGSPLLNRRASGPWGSVAAPQAPYAQPPPGASGASPRSGGIGSFLESAAMTAAGVAGGALLFQGLSGFLGGHHGAWGGDASAFTHSDSGFADRTDFSSVNDQVESSDTQLTDAAGDFGSIDDSIG